MATGMGKNKGMPSYGVLSVLVFSLVPLCATLTIQIEKIYLTVPHNAEAGHVVLKNTDFIQNCTETKQVHKSQITQSNLVSIERDGTLVINTNLYNNIGDSFIVQQNPSPSCSESSRRHSTDSNPKQIHVEIVHSDKSLRFVHESYTGFIERDSHRGTLVTGIRDLYACSYTECRNNLDYRIQGESDFYLQTILVDHHVTLQILSKDSLRNSEKQVHNLVIIAENSKGQTGHTSVQIKVKPSRTDLIVPDYDTLHFEKQPHFRRRRQTVEDLVDRSVNETQTGFIFDISEAQTPPAGETWTYHLLGSSLENAFTVTTAGAVAVAPGYNLDYEALTADGSQAIVKITVEVRRNGGEVVKELAQTMQILDVNDENPVFTNTPQPFLATMSLEDPDGTLIYTLTAQDPDAGAQLTLAAGTGVQSDNDLFTISINGNKADISKRALSGNQQITANQELRVVVTATDTAAPTLQRTTAEVLIRAGTRPPQFYQPSYTIEFQENNAVNQLISQSIEVKSFQQNQVSCAVYTTGSQVSSIFTAQAVSSNNNQLHRCNIRVGRIFDYENNQQQYQVTVRATEDTTGLSSEVQATIQVTDQNEFPPRFSRSTYKLENVYENITIGSALITVTATDDDSNTKLSFTVDNDSFEVVSLNPDSTTNPHTAEIRVKKHLDYDSISPKLYDFTVSAMDDDPASKKTGQATVRVFMENLNDEYPEFPEVMSTDVRYDATVGAEVFRVQGTDKDEGDILSYSIVGGADGKFAMDSSSGRITLSQIIATNQESITKFVYELIVIATDDGGCCGGTNRLTSTGTVTINILTDNLNPPTFPDCATYRPSVVEEKANEPVIQVTATDQDFGPFGNVTYSIREPNSPFRIDNITGQIYTDVAIDREGLVGTTNIPVNVIATDGGNLQSSCALLVLITDVNDNRPIFSQSVYTVTIVKTMIIGSVAARVEATDADISLNANIEYFLIENRDNVFRMDDTDRLTGDIRVNRSLISLEGETFNLVVMAQDQGSTPLNSNVTVTLTIGSSTETPPEFQPGNYAVSVNESLSIGETITTIIAKSNNVLEFVLVPLSTTFSADKVVQTDDTAQDPQIQMARLRLLAVLDYETTRSYTLTVRASDAVTQLAAEQRITIDITDTNDNIPTFPGVDPESNFLDLQLLEGNYSTEPLPGKEVGQIVAVDADGTSPNNQIDSYSLITPGDFTIDSRTGRLYTRGVFDREDPAGFLILVSVRAVDAAPSSIFRDGSANTGQVTVRITITDVNDNAPEFTQPVYTFTAPEDLGAGVNVDGAKVLAVDPDSDAVLIYSITTTPAPPFQVQSRTGQIIVSGALDYDLGQKRYEFEVRVFDSIFSSNARVVMTITDVNDNPPQVPDFTFEQFRENDTSVIGNIQLIQPTDIDNNGSNSFYYKLLFTDDNDAQYFSIDNSGETAQLRITQALDRDLPNGKSEFLFTIEVADGLPGTNELYGYGTVSVKPIDINDNAPHLVVSLLTVPENEPAGTLVDKVQLLDYDAGVNSEFTATIVSQSPDSVFSLNSNTLDLTTTTSLDRETTDTYFVVIQAIDKGTPAQTGTVTLTVSVQDKNDNAPYFLQDQYTFVTSESLIEGGEVGRIKALDNDIGVNAEITYSLDTEDVIYFAMNQDSEKSEGVLVIFQSIDFDGGLRNFNLTAYAEDNNPGPNNENRAVTYIEVVITDYNDETPIFEPDKKNTSVPENIAVGYVLEQFTATDRDVNPEYSRFEYFIQQKSDPYNQFAIDAQGRVTVKNSLDREQIAEHQVVILAIDNPDGADGFPQNTGSATLTVTVTDINDNYPRFKEDYRITLQEEQNFVNVEIITLSIVDDDLPENGPPFSIRLDCNYGNASTQCGKFSLQNTATLFVNGQFNREEEKKVLLPFELCDVVGSNRNDQQCGYRFLDIAILDINDNTHSDGQQDIIVYNYKGLYGNIVIGTVNENDLDDGVETDKVFQLLNAEIAGEFVSIETNTGKITLKENVPEISFEIKVNVIDQTGLTHVTAVRIQVVYIPDDAVYNSGSVRIQGITPEDFLYKPLENNILQDSMYDKFRDTLTRKLFGQSTPTLRENVQILTVLPANNGSATDVRFAAHGSPYYQDSRLNGLVTSNRDEFNQALTIRKDKRDVTGQIDMVPIDMCQFESCEGGCFNQLLVTESPVLIDTRGSSFVGVDARVNGTCGCAAKDFSGDVDCEPGYCYHGGECVKDDWGVVSCNCTDGFDGPRCQMLRQNFDGTGYAMYKQFEQCEQSRTSIEILTSKANPLILYNGPINDLGQTEPQDFILLELENGYPKLRIDHGTGEITVQITGNNRKRLNDGVWHRIDIYRDQKKVRLVVDNCDNSIFINGVENRSNCEASGITKGENIFLNVDDLLQLGGRSTNPSYPTGVTTERFDGCMKNLIHNAEIYDLSTGGVFPGSSDGCPGEDNVCDPKCENGQCLITSNTNNVAQGMCICSAGFRESTPGKCDLETTIRDLESYSFMDWNLKAAFLALLNSRTNRLSFHFRTRDQDGIMFGINDQSDSNKYVTVRMTGGRLQVAYNLGDNPNRIQLSDVTAANGQWHKVVLERSGKEFILMMDSGEGRYYVDTPGPAVGNIDFTVRQDQIYSGAAVDYSSGTGSVIIDNMDDLNSSCINDIRMEYEWFPMTLDESGLSKAATFYTQANTRVGCMRNDCPANRCRPPFECVALWENFDCVCPEYNIRSADTCVPIDYCASNPCFGPSTCNNNVPPGEGENPFTCTCSGEWYGPICQCHPSLLPGGMECQREGEEEEQTGLASGALIGIILGILFFIVLILLVGYFVWKKCRGSGSQSKLIPDEKDIDYDDDIRENIMFYDEEGAGEEDQTTYDLSRLRKPDDSEGPGMWDAPDIRKVNTNPLGTAQGRPDVGDFINDRLQDADNDPNAPPVDTPHIFQAEGGGSEAGSLSSLNTSSSGSQDYDYLNEWGPKFAKLADMYNNYDESE